MFHTEVRGNGMDIVINDYQVVKDFEHKYKILKLMLIRNRNQISFL